MLRSILGLMLLTACSMGTVKTGGERPHVYEVDKDHSIEEIRRISKDVVAVSKRGPPVGKLEDLFGPGQSPLKRVGIIVFETIIQPTRGGLAGEDKVYLSAQGKQLLTERLLNIWEEAFPIMARDIDYVPVAKIRQAPSMKKYGTEVEDHIKTKRSSLAPDDIFFKEKGEKTTTATVFNPRGLRDLSLLLVPATELMMGPKWSEHQKHFVNDIMKERKLDAALIVMSELSWTASHMDKHSGEYVPEEIKVKISSSTLVSLSEYHKRLKKLGSQDLPGVTLCYRAYEGTLKTPVQLSLPKPDRNFEAIERELVSPLLKTYRDLALMTIDRMGEDLRKTF